MAWWSSISSASKLATSALKEAQKKIDRVLAIDDDALHDGKQESPSSSYFDGNFLLARAESSPERAGVSPASTEIPAEMATRHNRRASSSLSSGPMPESEVGEDILGSALLEHEKPSSLTSAPDFASSISMPQGNASSSLEMSTSDTLGAESSLQQSLIKASTGQDWVEKTEEATPKLDGPLAEVQIEVSASGTAVASTPSKPRVDEESIATTTSSEIEVISTCTSVYEDSASHLNTILSRPFIGTGVSDATASQDFLHQKLAEAAKLLESREAKLVEISRTNLSLLEVNEFLHAKLEEAGLPHDLNAAGLQSLTDEFTERLATTERKLQAIARERDQLRAQLLTANTSTEQTIKRAYVEQEKALRARCARLESSLVDKETQLADLLAEGNRMAQEQLKTNNMIKTLRSKTKSLELEKEKSSNNLTKAQTEIESLKSEIATMRDNEKKLQESLNQLNRKNLKLEKDVIAVKDELDSSKEKVEALDRVRLELESKLSDSAVGLATAQRALSEAQTRTEAIRDVEEEQQSLRDEVSTLRTKLEETRVTAVRQKLDAEQRLQQVRQEVSHYREQLAESEARFESLGETATSVAKPLLQQIQTLQAKLAEQAKASEATEQSLLALVADLKKRLEVAEKTGRLFQERLSGAETAADALKEELALERAASSKMHDRLSQHDLLASSAKSHIEKLNAELASLQQKLVAAEDACDTTSSALVAEREEMVGLRSELAQVKAELAQALAKTATTTVTASTSPHQLMETNSLRLSGTHMLALTSQDFCTNPFLETDMPVQQPSPPPPPRPSPLPTGHFASSLSFLQSLLRQREGEVGQLRREVARLNETHERLLAALSEQTAKADQRTIPDHSLPANQGDEESLSQRYEVLLHLYGRKLEENEELRMDLREAKEAYQTQLNELLTKLNDDR
ncbi:TATA element modulatory factor [Taenia crassiceps]|uniref:TATA element modulatory factor n=1 Tax=Taenia crassiceps TaxID=6207 RepID=A0ABR4QD21_9CEST